MTWKKNETAVVPSNRTGQTHLNIDNRQVRGPPTPPEQNPPKRRVFNNNKMSEELEKML